MLPFEPDSFSDSASMASHTTLDISAHTISVTGDGTTSATVRDHGLASGATGSDMQMHADTAIQSVGQLQLCRPAKHDCRPLDSADACLVSGMQPGGTFGGLIAC